MKGIDHLPLKITLDEDQLEHLADVVAARLADRFPQQSTKIGWFDTAAAATYLGVSVTALHKLTSARQLAFSQSAPGGRCFFRRADLDAFRDQSMKGG